jgi:hypothetical protein
LNCGQFLLRKSGTHDGVRHKEKTIAHSMIIVHPCRGVRLAPMLLGVSLMSPLTLS